MDDDFSLYTCIYFLESNTQIYREQELSRVKKASINGGAREEDVETEADRKAKSYALFHVVTKKRVAGFFFFLTVSHGSRRKEKFVQRQDQTYLELRRTR